jgi:hypothetical protein
MSTWRKGDNTGSYLVPAEFRQQIVDLVYAGDDPLIDLIKPEPTSSNRVVGLGDNPRRGALPASRPIGASRPSR